MDLGEITADYSESGRPSGSGVGGESSTEEVSRTGRPGGNQYGQGTSEQEQENSLERSLSNAGMTAGSSGIVISSLEQLSSSINLGNLSEVRQIDLDGQDVSGGYFILAKALESGLMSALELLWLRDTGLTGNCSEAICKALTLGRFPSLTSLDFASNKMGTKGVEALGRAIQSGNLRTLAQLSLYCVAINDDDMAVLATAFADGDDSVLPNLWRLDLEANSFTEAGLKSLANALTSGRLDSLHSLDVQGCLNLSEEGASALVSAFTLNSCLTVAVNFEWYRFPELHRRQQQLRERNIRFKGNLANLSDFGMVDATFGKVYLCGNPGVGKTTLRRTLQRTFWQSFFTWERKTRVEQRTRGIDVSHFSSKDDKEEEKQLTLFVWDMAGQEEYHLVHNAFFPDLSSAEGKATIFVIVCTSQDPGKAKNEVRYWLQYIASSCHKTTTRLRHVFVVVNRMGGDLKVQEFEEDWKTFLQALRDEFLAYLDVHTETFVVDLRRRRKVKVLKIRLLEHSRDLLKKQKVPAVCKVIQNRLSSWSEAKKDFPVLHWKEYVQKVESIDLLSEQRSEPLLKRIIEAATRYLNEAGVLIHIDKSFPSHWGIPYEQLIVLIPNWFCNEVIGNIFLTEEMAGYRERHRLFRKKVDQTTGSVSISDFKAFFESKWSDEDLNDMLAILLWLGLCYKGKNENLFIPSLIDKNEDKGGKAGGPWQPQRAATNDADEWVMGFSVLHKESAITLAPMTLWHRFQVELAQTPKFNGERLDNDFVADKYLVTFAVEYMNVLIGVDVKKDFPTFKEITILVKPKFAPEEDVISGQERKQHQVNLANDLVDILLGLWDDICGGVQYVHKVVWPWPASETSQPQYSLDKSLEVADVKRRVQTNGMGTRMQWDVRGAVGRGSGITEDQLLSTKDKYNVIKSAENDVSTLMKRAEEAVKLRIYPSQLIEESSTEAAVAAPDQIEEDTQLGPDARILLKVLGGKVDKVAGKLDELAEKLNEVEDMLREGFAKVLKEQKRMFRKVQDTEQFFKEDKDRTCPNLMYLGQKDPGKWASLKQALSPSVNVRLRFACEAGYNHYRPHEVQGQEGLDVSTLRPTLTKIAPWLKVSLTIFLISAKIAANVVAPGAGLIVPNFDQLQQASSLLDGIVWATGFPMEELDKLMIDEMKLDANDILNPRDVYGKSREAITDLIRKLTPETYEQKFRLRRVRLIYSDDSLHGVVWICSECLKKFRESGLVSEM